MDTAIEKTVMALHELRDAVIRLEGRVEGMEVMIRDGAKGTIPERIFACELKMDQMLRDITELRKAAAASQEKWQDRLWDLAKPLLSAALAAGGTYLVMHG